MFKNLAICFLGFLSFWSNAQDFQITKDLKNEWYVYSESEKSFLPYLTEFGEAYSAHTLLLDLTSSKNYNLYLASKLPNQSIFINGALVEVLQPNVYQTIPLQSFSGKTAVITIVGSADISQKLAYLGIPGTVENNAGQRVNGKKELLTMSRKLEVPFQNGLVICFVLVFSLITATSFSYPKAFVRFVNLFKAFVSDQRDESMFYSKPLSRVNMAHLVTLSALYAIVIWLFLGKGLKLQLADLFLVANNTTIKQFLNFLMLFLVSLSLFGVKFIYLRLVSSVFGLERFSDYHIYKTIQISLSLLWPSLLVLFWIYFNSSVTEWSQNVFKTLFLAFYGVRLLGFFITLNKSNSIQFHYFIAYLCVVEVLPLILAVRFIF